ncbi:MAG: aspartyl-tRNA synthetase [Gammaproteobacteria bacterium]
MRDVIAFPKTTKATDLFCGAPAPVDPAQLADVHVELAASAKMPAAEDPSADSPVETSV